MKLALLLLSALLASIAGCNTNPGVPPVVGTATGSGGAAFTGKGPGTASGDGGISGPGGAAGSGVDAGAVVDPGSELPVLCGASALTSTLIIPAGKTLMICAGSTVTASAGVSLTVQGRLVVQGTADLPVKLIGAAATPEAWTGVILDDGGSLDASYLEIHDATTALAARPGSMFNVDHLAIDDSSMMLVLSSSGVITHGRLHGLGDQQSSTPIFVSSASPRITDTVVTAGLYGGVDMIVVIGGGSAPVFDHLEVADSHCAFHFDAGNGVIISNSYVHHNSYGLMVGGSVAGHVVHNNFQDNYFNIGACGGGSTEVADNYFEGAPLDGSCADLAVTGVTPASPYATGVGPAP